MVFILLIMFLNISSSLGDSWVISLDILPVVRSGTRKVLLNSWFSSMMPDHGNKCRILRPTTTSISITVNNRWRCSKTATPKKNGKRMGTKRRQLKRRGRHSRTLAHPQTSGVAGGKACVWGRRVPRGRFLSLAPHPCLSAVICVRNFFTDSWSLILDSLRSRSCMVR
jgi:hypothetical protein